MSISKFFLSLIFYNQCDDILASAISAEFLHRKVMKLWKLISRLA